MERLFYIEGMSKSKAPTQPESNIKSETNEQVFFFPVVGKTIVASSISEARRLLVEKLTKGKTQKVGDGNI